MTGTIQWTSGRLAQPRISSASVHGTNPVRLTEEKRRDRDKNRHVERQIQPHFRLWLPIAVVQRVDDVFLIGAVTCVCHATGDKVSHEGKTLLTEVEVVDVAEYEGE